MPNDFVTRDSGERKVYATGMQRETTGEKIRFDLVVIKGLPFEEQMLTRWAALLTRGAAKYEPRNYEVAETQEELDRFLEAAFRHFMQWYHDVQDGEDHGAAVFFNIAGAELVRGRMEKE